MSNPRPTVRLIFATLGAAIVLSMASLAGASAAAVLSGQITDRATARPLPGADISLFAAGASSPLVNTQAIVNGSYIVHVRRPGAYRVRVDATDYVPCWRTISSSGHGGLTLNVSLPPQPLLHLRLLLPDGKPLGPHAVQPTPKSPFSFPPHVDISILVSPRGRGPSMYQASWFNIPPPDQVLPAQWHVVRNGKTDVALSQPLPHGSVMVGVAARMEGVGAAQVILNHWPVGPVVLRLRPGCAIRVRVLGAGDTSVKGANPSFLGLDEDLGLRALQPTDLFSTSSAGPDGWSTLANLPPGRYIVSASDPKGFSLSRVVEAEAPLSSVVLREPDDEAGQFNAAWGPTVQPWSQVWRTEVRLRPGPPAPVQLNGTVVDAASGRPVGEASVAVYVPGDPAIPLDIARCADDGSFHLTTPGEGTYRIREFDPVHLFAETTIHAATGPVAIRAARRPILHLTVLDENGRTLGEHAAEVVVYAIGKNAAGVVGTGIDTAPGPAFSLMAPREVPPGDVKRLVIRAMSDTGIAQISLPHWPAGPVRVQLQSGMALSGKLDGDPGETPSVVLDRVDGPRPRLSILARNTGPHGFVARPLLPGHYLLRWYTRKLRMHYRAVNITGPEQHITLTPNDPATPPARTPG